MRYNGVMADSSLFAPEGYTLVRAIARGAGSVTWEARRPATAEPVAVTVLDSAVADPTALHRFARECAAMAAASRDPHVLTVLDSGVHDARPWLATELHRRGSLAAHGGPLDVPGALRVLARLADALTAAHAAGVVHGAVTPAEVLVTDAGEPVLGGFAVARLAGADPEHAAPEQLDGGPPSPRSDVYSLGGTVWELLAGHPPRRRAGELAVPLPPAPLPDDGVVPADVLALLRATTAVDPADRPASPAVVRAAAGRLARARGIDLDGPVLPPAATPRAAPAVASDAWTTPLPAELLTSVARPVTEMAPYTAEADGAPLCTTPVPFRPRADDDEPVRRRRVPMVAASVLAVLVTVGTAVGVRQVRAEPPPVTITPAALVPSAPTAPPTTTAAPTTEPTSATPAPSSRRARATTTTTRPRPATRPATPTTRATPRPVAAPPPTTEQPRPEPTRPPSEQPEPSAEPAPEPGGGTGGSGGTGTGPGSGSTESPDASGGG